MEEYLFRARTVQTSVIKSLFSLLAGVIIDCNIIVTKTCIKIIQLNNTQIALIHIKLDAEEFEDYNYEEEESLILGIHTDSFLKIIKTIKHDETISFFVKKDEPSFLYIKKESNGRNSTNSFKLPLENIDYENYTLPPVDFDTNITMSSTEFQRLCKNFSSLGAKTIEIKSVGDRVFLSGNGEFCSFEGIIGYSGETSFSNSTTNVIQSIFDTRYLLLFSSASGLSKTVNLYLKNDYPLIMSYKIGTLGEIRFIISSISTSEMAP
jgi:proliferating cell nuclear antigen